MEEVSDPGYLVNKLYIRFSASIPVEFSDHESTPLFKHRLRYFPPVVSGIVHPGPQGKCFLYGKLSAGAGFRRTRRCAQPFPRAVEAIPANRNVIAAARCNPNASDVDSHLIG